jgi:hypothetical protein
MEKMSAVQQWWMKERKAGRGRDTSILAKHNVEQMSGKVCVACTSYENEFMPQCLLIERTLHFGMPKDNIE